jgi:hypothetical protein
MKYGFMPYPSCTRWGSRYETWIQSDEKNRTSMAVELTPSTS